jgi:hypothetical protein
MKLKKSSLLVILCAVGLLAYLLYPTITSSAKGRDRRLSLEKRYPQTIVEAMVAYAVDNGSFYIDSNSISKDLENYLDDELVEFSREKKLVYNEGLKVSDWSSTDWVIMNFEAAKRGYVIIVFGDSHAETVDLKNVVNVFDN